METLSLFLCQQLVWPDSLVTIVLLYIATAAAATAAPIVARAASLVTAATTEEEDHLQQQQTNSWICRTGSKCRSVHKLDVTSDIHQSGWIPALAWLCPADSMSAIS